MSVSRSDIIVAIGRNVGDQPMHIDPWAAFQADLFEVLGQNSVVLAAVIDGDAHSSVWTPEDSLWVAGSIPTDDLDFLRRDLRHLAEAYEQDAIALTVGRTDLLSP